MGYALKLSSVDFSGVAVGQVTLVDPVPCTALSLDQSTLSFDSAEETKTLTATKTPSYTTDALTWASSNTNVATVVNGVVTIHGIGSATITATCGEQTATATISQSSIKPNGGSKILEGYAPDTYADAITVGSVSGQNAFGQDYADNEKLRVRGVATSSIQMIPVPYGATKAKVATTNSTAVTISYMYIADMNDLVGTTTKYPKYKSRAEFVNSNNGGAVEYGQCIMFRPTDSQAATLDYVYFT